MAVLDLDRTRGIQWQASNPAASAWVVANAGSGKTHVLTQRVIRLLLAGADPAAILCLTFTKVAAAEMAGRVFGTLGQWATLPEARLKAEIETLQGDPPAPAQLRQARRLFARALETPGGLKIQTIHAFCERLLHQFPFEANVPGHFAILDDTQAAALIAGARSTAMTEAAAGPQTRLGRAMRYLAEHATDGQIAAALDAVIAKREAVERWIMISGEEGGTGSVDDALADLRRRLDLRPDETEASICRAICDGADWKREDCGKLSRALGDALAAAENRNDREAQAALQALAGSADPLREAELRLAFFLVDDKDSGGWKGRSEAQRFGAAFGRSQAGLGGRFVAEAERLLGLADRLRLARNFAATEALLIVGDTILRAYRRAKRRAGLLDFADLISKTRNLLSRGEAAAWVLYKLDARIEHILVDEAQDTSPDQWAVVQAIAADFFAGDTATAARRTIFAVGDDKQSIFGFQGAAPHMLAEMGRFFARAVADAEAEFVRVPLALSFRSTTEVLGAVDAVFSRELAEKVTASGYVAHSARRLTEPGQVIVLPRVVRARAAEPENWTEPFDAPTAADVALADIIADEIGRLIGTTLPSGTRVTPGGILILARKRDAFVSAMNRSLRGRGIGTAGADRIPAATHIAALDLLALADVMLLAEDDLQLAACLKSPLIGLTEDELMRLAERADRASLWSALQASPDERFRPVAAQLNSWRAMADQVTPFRFFATLLGPDGGRRRFRERLGGEADDVLDAFLSRALAYEAIEPPSLQGFLGFVRSSESDIKRDGEESSAGVRVMTVHGAKGLEADIVFLVDTGGQVVVPGHRDVLVPIGEGRLLWRRPGLDATQLQRRADAKADAETESEYLRLLYVAMTRARDVLYVAGIKGERTPENCWYSIVEKALVPAGTERDAEAELLAPHIWPPERRAPSAGPAAPERAMPESADLPAWLFQPAPSPLPAPQPLRPSQALAELDPLPARGSDADRHAGEAALARGLALHRALAALPAIPAKERRARAARMLQRDLFDTAVADEVTREAEALIADPALADAFGPQSRAEVPIVGRVSTAGGDYAVSGRIDRLARTPAGWLIVEFKTNRDVPADPASVDPAYVLQLALYRRLLLEMDPGQEVRATLVWTAGPNVMPIPAPLMEQALAKLGIFAKPVP